MAPPTAATLSAALRAQLLAYPASGALNNAGLTAFCDALAAAIWASSPGRTAEGGYTIDLLNDTGADSVKGSVVSASTSTDGAFELQANRLDAIGVVYDDGIPDGGLCRVAIAGQADVLLEDGAGASAGDWLGGADTDGRAYAKTSPGPPVTTAEHFREIGHCLQTVASGTDVLARATLHFN